MSGRLQIRAIDLNDGPSMETWDHCVQQSSQGFCFAQGGWLLAQRIHLNQKIQALGVFEGERLIGGLPLVEFGRWGIRGARRPWATPYNHPFFLNSLSDTTIQDARATLQHFLPARYHFVSIASSYLTSERPLQSAPYHIRTKATILLDTSNLKDLWDRFQSELRNRIRKARKLGITVCEAGALDEFYDLYLNLFSAQGRRVPFTRDQFDGFCRAVKAGGLGNIFEARDPRGRLHVAALITWDAHTGYYTLSASHPELRKSGANGLLLWEVFERLSGQVNRFDMIGANLPSITRFKNRFRGETVTYFESSYFSKSWLRPGLQLLHRLGRI